MYLSLKDILKKLENLILHKFVHILSHFKFWKIFLALIILVHIGYFAKKK